MRAVVLISLMALAACGANGEPEPRTTGISISGEARIGVEGSL